MKISPVKFNTFKGYDAAPLKRIYLDEFCDTDIASEMKNICADNEIIFDAFHDCSKWTQDDKTIIQYQSRPLLITNGNTGLSTIADDDEYKIPCVKKDGFLTGGDTFIGKKENGEKWILSGCGYLDDKKKEKVASTYNVKKRKYICTSKP